MNEIKNCRVENFKNPITDCPGGGCVEGIGINIRWQEGAIQESGVNGAFVETVISAAIQRLDFFQDSPFKCRENAVALTHLETALLWLEKRTQNRIDRGVEGTHKI